MSIGQCYFWSPFQCLPSISSHCCLSWGSALFSLEALGCGLGGRRQGPVSRGCHTQGRPPKPVGSPPVSESRSAEACPPKKIQALLGITSRKQCHFCLFILQCPLWFVWGGTIYDKNTGLPAIDLALFILAPGCFLSNPKLLLLWP